MEMGQVAAGRVDLWQRSPYTSVANGALTSIAVPTPPTSSNPGGPDRTSMLPYVDTPDVKQASLCLSWGEK